MGNILIEVSRFCADLFSKLKVGMPANHECGDLFSKLKVVGMPANHEACLYFPTRSGDVLFMS